MQRVLLIDDDELVLCALRRAVGKYNEWQAEFALGPTEGLSVLKRDAFDAVVCDFNMPQMSGDQVLAQVKQLYPDAVRVIFTGQGAEANISSTLAHQLWTKPWDTRGLIASLRQIFKVRAMLDDPRS